MRTIQDLKELEKYIVELSQDEIVVKATIPNSLIVKLQALGLNIVYVL